MRKNYEYTVYSWSAEKSNPATRREIMGEMRRDGWQHVFTSIHPVAPQGILRKTVMSFRRPVDADCDIVYRTDVRGNILVCYSRETLVTPEMARLTRKIAKQHFEFGPGGEIYTS